MGSIWRKNASSWCPPLSRLDHGCQKEVYFRFVLRSHGVLYVIYELSERYHFSLAENGGGIMEEWPSLSSILIRPPPLLLPIPPFFSFLLLIVLLVFHLAHLPLKTPQPPLPVHFLLPTPPPLPPLLLLLSSISSSLLSSSLIFLLPFFLIPSYTSSTSNFSPSYSVKNPSSSFSSSSSLYSSFSSFFSSYYQQYSE